MASYMYAHDWGQRTIRHATSEDGLDWSRLDQPLLSQVRTPDHWEAGQIGRPTMLRQGDEWWLYYSATEGGEPSMGLAVATDWSP